MVGEGLLYMHLSAVCVQNFNKKYAVRIIFADPGSSGPMHPPSIGSPMPPLTPPLLDNKQGLEDRRVPRPIGGERAQRKLPLSSASSGFGGVGEFGNKLWCFSSGECDIREAVST